MDDATKRVLKDQLLHDVYKWVSPDPRGFKDIVRNAADVDLKYLAAIMKAFKVDRGTVRGWGSGGIVPPDYERYVIIEEIRKIIENDLGAATEVKH